MGEVFQESLAELIAEGEHERLEFKRGSVLTEPNAENKAKIRRELVGLANREGGNILFGVRDDGSVEGIDIWLESALETVTNEARMNCSPPVEFEHTYYSAEEDDLEEGSIFLVSVEPYEGQPHAIVNRKGDEIRTREYRVRTGEATRLITDEELRIMFTEEWEPLQFEPYRTWVPVSTTITESQPPDVTLRFYPESGEYLTDAYQSFLPFLEHFRAYDFDTHPDPPDLGHYLYHDVYDSPLELAERFVLDSAPFALLNDLRKLFVDEWDIKISYNNLQNKRRIQQRARTAPTDEISQGDVEVIGEGRRLEDFVINPAEGVFFEDQRHYWSTYRRLTVPADTSVKLYMGTDDHPRVSWTDSSCLTFEKDSEFVLDIGFNVRSSGKGIPIDHPANILDRITDRGTDTEYIELGIVSNVEFDFPDSQSEHLQQHRDFVENVMKFIELTWDIDKIAEDLYEREIIEISNMMSKVLNRMDRMTD